MRFAGAAKVLTHHPPLAEIDSDPNCSEEDYAAWLGEAPAMPAQLKAMLKPFSAELMEAVKVSTKVNNVKNEGLEVVEEVAQR